MDRLATELRSGFGCEMNRLVKSLTMTFLIRDFSISVAMRSSHEDIA